MVRHGAAAGNPVAAVREPRARRYNPPVAMALPTTRWSVVTRAAAADPATARRALGELCEAYWAPLHAFACRLGLDDDTARDRVQSFCLQLLQRGGVDGADRAVGRFRNYLLGAFRNFLRNEARAERSFARGGGVAPVELDAAALAGPDGQQPERLFEQRWAWALLDRARLRLRADYDTPAKQRLLLRLEPALLGQDAGRSAAVARELGTTEGAVRVALHRLRQRWRELVREEVAQTVDDPAGIDDELRALRDALAGGRPPRAKFDGNPGNGHAPTGS